MDKQKFLRDLRDLNTDGKTAVQLYNEISTLAMNLLDIDNKPNRCAHYLSIEFLIGRVFNNNLLELGVIDEVQAVLKDKGLNIAMFEEIEDAALGNGGLGRLAACYMDSGAAVGIPLYGYGLRYKYGLFHQKFEDGFQKEYPDDWQQFGDPWSIRREAESQVIRFADMEAVAVPYDMPIIGERVNTLRFYQAEGSVEAEEICRVLYPSDDTEEGKLLRIRQEYFLSAAAVGDIVRNYEARHGGDYSKLVEENSIQLNDTHPVFAVPELIRVLMGKGVSFATALRFAKAMFNYTNHTILPEALECWDIKLLRKILPEITDILAALARSARSQHKKEGYSAEEMDKTAIYDAKHKKFSMANTAVFVSNQINGVAELHSDIIKDRLFNAEYVHHPEKFTNVTNGVAQRRWMELCNPELCNMIDKRIGAEWRHNFKELAKLTAHTSDESVIKDFIEVKGLKKKQLFDYIDAVEGVKIDGGRVMYAQVKRLHEYKRQLMTALGLIRLYNDLKDGKLKDFRPSVFLFGAKSAPSYSRAKAIIKFLNEIIAKINSDPDTRDKLMGVFVTEYNVSYAEKIVAAADVSLQISTAGLEASGTGNMKFMMNGAVTLGTMDGANIEIVHEAGLNNNYIFGARVDEIEKLKNGDYNPQQILDGNSDWNRAVSTLIDGTFSDEGTGMFKELYNSLTVGASWHKPDHYFIFRDLEEYYQAILKVNEDSKNQYSFATKQLNNTATSAHFSSDRSILEYANRIWKL